jgi:hypothetical protein
MSSFVLPGFGSMRGFGIPGVPNGFCGGFAVVSVNTHRPSVYDAGYSLTQAGMAKTFALAYQRHYCASNGAMTIQGAYALLSAIASGSHQLVDEAHFDMTTYHVALKDILTRQTGVITLWANGQAFPGDELGLHYHFTGQGGIDTSGPGYATSDDDWSGNVWPAAKDAPVWRTWTTLSAAQPIAYIICAA